MGSARSSQVPTCHSPHVRLVEEMDGCVYTEDQNNIDGEIQRARVSCGEVEEGAWVPAERR